jgi:hypothetical protein
VLPTRAALADPSTILSDVCSALRTVDRDAADPGNLFRVHWYTTAIAALGGVPHRDRELREAGG